MEENKTTVTNEETQNEGQNDSTQTTVELTQEQKEELFAEFTRITELQHQKKDVAVAKSLIEQKGVSNITAEELLAAVKSLNDNKVDEMSTLVNTLQTENEDLKNQLFNLNITAEAKKMSTELGFDEKYTSQILKLADLSKAKSEDGTLNGEEFKSAIQAVLGDCDAFMIKEASTPAKHFTNVGAPNPDEAAKSKTDDVMAAVRKAAGLK